MAEKQAQVASRPLYCQPLGQLRHTDMLNDELYGDEGEKIKLPNEEDALGTRDDGSLDRRRPCTRAYRWNVEVGSCCTAWF